MTKMHIFKTCVAVVALTSLAACGGRGGRAPGGPLVAGDAEGYINRSDIGKPTEKAPEGGSIFDLFKKKDNDTNVAVNKYLWNASLEVLNFLPIQSIDPFTGVIVTGYGTPPGGGGAYRATIYIKDPALEARSLVVSMQSRRGPVSASTQRAVEDAILGRARQLRIADGRL